MIFEHPVHLTKYYFRKICSYLSSYSTGLSVSLPSILRRDSSCPRPAKPLPCPGSRDQAQTSPVISQTLKMNIVFNIAGIYCIPCPKSRPMLEI